MVKKTIAALICACACIGLAHSGQSNKTPKPPDLHYCERLAQTYALALGARLTNERAADALQFMSPKMMGKGANDAPLEPLSTAQQKRIINQVYFEDNFASWTDPNRLSVTVVHFCMNPSEIDEPLQ